MGSFLGTGGQPGPTGTTCSGCILCQTRLFFGCKGGHDARQQLGNVLKTPATCRLV